MSSELDFLKNIFGDEEESSTESEDEEAEAMEDQEMKIDNIACGDQEGG